MGQEGLNFCNARFTVLGDKKRHLLGISHKDIPIPKEGTSAWEELLNIGNDSVKFEGHVESIPLETNDNHDDQVSEKLSNMPDADFNNFLSDTVKTEFCTTEEQSTTTINQDSLRKLTPLEAIVSRIENNEIITADEMIASIDLICNS